MVDGVVLHVGLDLVQRKADFFQDADGVQIIELAGAVVAVAVVGVGVGRTKQADLVVKNEGLPGNVLLL